MGNNRVTVRKDNIKLVARALRAAPSVKVGYPLETTGSIDRDGVPLAQVAAFAEFGTENTPPRRFMTQGAAIFATRTGLLTPHARRFVEGKMSPLVFGGVMGALFKSSIVAAIDRQNFAPLAEATVKAKGNDTILVDESVMRDNVSFVVVS